MKISLLSDLWKTKKTNNEIKININKKDKINKPLSGSLANVWTEFIIPDLTKKVPDILNVKVVIDKIITQDLYLRYNWIHQIDSDCITLSIEKNY